MYIIEAREHEPRPPNTRSRRDTIRHVIVGQFNLSFNLNTGVFALGGSRLSAEQWMTLRYEVDEFLVKYKLIEKLEVHDFRPSLSKRARGIVRWLIKR